MSRIAVHSIRRATTDEAYVASPGDISRVLNMGVYTVTILQTGPALTAGATGFLLKGISGMTLARIDGSASTSTNIPDQVLVLANTEVYLPARAGQTISMIELT